MIVGSTVLAGLLTAVAAPTPTPTPPATRQEKPSFLGAPVSVHVFRSRAAEVRATSANLHLPGVAPGAGAPS